MGDDMIEISPIVSKVKKKEKAPRIHWVLTFDSPNIDMWEEETGWWETYQEHCREAKLNDMEIPTFEDYMIRELKESVSKDPWDVYLEWFDIQENLVESAKLSIEIDMNGIVEDEVEEEKVEEEKDE